MIPDLREHFLFNALPGGLPVVPREGLLKVRGTNLVQLEHPNLWNRLALPLAFVAVALAFTGGFEEPAKKSNKKTSY